MKFDEFLPYVAPYVPGCPEAVMREHVRWAARDFCSKTELWQVESMPMLTAPGIGTYPLDLDEDQELVKLIASDATVGGSTYSVLTPGQGRSWSRNSAGGRRIYLEGSQDLVISPTPTVAGDAIVVQMVVKPALAAAEWPDEFKEYARDIAYGAIASLAFLPKKTWTDRQQALDMGTLFADRIATVGMKVSQGFTGRFQRRRTRFL